MNNGKMNWFQNLAGHAENLLTKLDQNAATVLSDGNEQSLEEDIKIQGSYIDPESRPAISNDSSIQKPSSAELKLTDEVKAEKNIDRPIDIPVSETKNIPSKTPVVNEKDSKMAKTLPPEFYSQQDLVNLNKRAKRENELKILNKQLLNFMHLYSEAKNERAALRFQVERMNEQLAFAQKEKEQYAARAQRILHEKEKLIAMKQKSQNSQEIDTEYINMSYNEELKKELEFQLNKVAELTDGNKKLFSDLQYLQVEHRVILGELQETNQILEKNLADQTRLRAMAEDDCNEKIKELRIKEHEINRLQECLKESYSKNLELERALQRGLEESESDESEIRLKSLTETLMVKQDMLENITAERNALILQLEKEEAEYKNALAELKREKVRVINVQEPNDETLLVPQFMRVSPRDAGVTRKVKHAYSTFDAISVRTGIFLRRYPLARVFVFSYMVILHIWVFTVLLWDVPSSR